jgi:hypothetical protein
MFKSSRLQMRQVERDRADSVRRREEEAERGRRGAENTRGLEPSRQYARREIAEYVYNRGRAAANLPPQSEIRAFSGILDPLNVPSNDRRAYAGNPTVVERIERLQRERGITFTEAVLVFGRENPAAYEEYRRSVHADVERTNMLRASGDAVRLFDQMVEDTRRTNPSLSAADAVTQVAAQHPDLARTRNAALSVPLSDGVMIR